MAWKKTMATMGTTKYPRKADELFEYLSGEINRNRANNIYITDGSNSMKLKSYGGAGVDANVELAINKDQFDAICSTLPYVLSGIKTYKKEDYYLVVELNLGKVARGEGGIETPFAEHIVYNDKDYDSDKKYFQVSLVFPENIRRKLENYGNCSAIDNDLPEANLALLIKEAALKDGFEESEKVYDCVTPVCPPPMKMDRKELHDFIKGSPSIKLEGRYIENKKAGKRESVLADITPSHVSLEGLFYASSNLEYGKIISPILESASLEFSNNASVELSERYTGFLESAYQRLKDGAKARSESKLLSSKKFAARRDAVNTALGAVCIPLAMGYGYLDRKLGFEEKRKAAEKEKELRDFFERTLSKGGVKRPDGSTCLAIMNKKCLIDKFNEKMGGKK